VGTCETPKGRALWPSAAPLPWLQSIVAGPWTELWLPTANSTNIVVCCILDTQLELKRTECAQNDTVRICEPAPAAKPSSENESGWCHGGIVVLIPPHRVHRCPIVPKRNGRSIHRGSVRLPTVPIVVRGKLATLAERFGAEAGRRDVFEALYLSRLIRAFSAIVAHRVSQGRQARAGPSVALGRHRLTGGPGSRRATALDAASAVALSFRR
jgi:hypothetical protein